MSDGYSTQNVVPTCLNDDAHQWGYNSKGQSPCDVAGGLLSACISQPVTIDPLPSTTDTYAGSVGDRMSDGCLCSTVYYAMISACAQCQGRYWKTWNDQIHHCLYKNVMGIPVDLDGHNITLPKWSWFDYTYLGTFSVAVAQGQITIPFSVTDTIPLPSTSPPAANATSGGGGGTTSPNALNGGGVGPTDVPAQNVKSSPPPIGAIVGGAIGGIFAIGIIACVMTWIVMKHKKKNNNLTGADRDKPALETGLTGASVTGVAVSASDVAGGQYYVHDEAAIISPPPYAPSQSYSKEIHLTYSDAQPATFNLYGAEHSRQS